MTADGSSNRSSDCNDTGRVDYTVDYNYRFSRKGAQTTPIPLRCGRMPVKRPELHEGEAILEDIANRYGLRVVTVRNLVKRHRPKVLRRVTCYRVYSLEEITGIVEEFLKRHGRGNATTTEPEQQK